MPGLFGFSAVVGQRQYAGFGLALMLLKYLVEAITIYSLTGKPYTPLDFVNPLLSAREKFTADAPLWLGMAWVLWTLPFLWIALTMSVRRAAFLRISPWWGLVVLVPVVNLLGMAVMASIPDSWAQPVSEAEKRRREEVDGQLAAAYQSPSVPPSPAPPARGSQPLSGVVAAILGLGGGAMFLVLVVLGSVYLFDSYGATMFFGTPVVTGALAAYCFNAPVRRSLALTLGHGVVTLTVACCAFLFLGFEGAICIVMAIPIMVPLGLLGSLIGYAIALGLGHPRHSEYRGLAGVVLAIPLLGWVESRTQPTPNFENMSAIEIAAPPEVVWNHVVQFSEITEPPEWYFRMGIASPSRARIDGAGVGAIRHCEFTTGAFVEPITVWDPPRRLAFDVTDQPEPMFELSPYRHIHPPHLAGSFRSQRGEFRIIGLPDGRTRLEGRTWYQLEIYPLSYWTIWTDAILHRIHGRVLRHIKRTAEAEELEKIAPTYLGGAARADGAMARAV
jgi:uncharacterized membrane protein YhaH (DUF805 family)